MIELNDSFLWVEDFEYLFFVGLRVGDDFFARQLFARFRFSGGITDHAGKVPDQKNDFMTQILELLHLLDQHRVTEVQIRRRGIEAGLDSEGAAALKFRRAALPPAKPRRHRA